MKNNLQTLLVICIMAGATFLGHKYPAFHPERSESIFGVAASNGDTVKIAKETPGAVKR